MDKMGIGNWLRQGQELNNEPQWYNSSFCVISAHEQKNKRRGNLWNVQMIHRFVLWKSSLTNIDESLNYQTFFLRCKCHSCGTEKYHWQQTQWRTEMKWAFLDVPYLGLLLGPLNILLSWMCSMIAEYSFQESTNPGHTLHVLLQ